MTKSSWSLGVVVALVSGCDSAVPVGDLAGGRDAGSIDASTAPDRGGPADGGMQEGTRSDSGQGAPGSGSNATTYFTAVTSGLLQSACGNSCPCLPITLPTDATGQASCQLFFELGSGDTCAAHSLSIAAPDVVASVRAAGGSQSGAVCVVPQLPSTQWVNGSCAGSTQQGWCYVTGAAAGACPQRLTTSTPTVLPAGAFALLGCGETPATGAPGATSTGPVGSTCVPSPEQSSSFGGFDHRAVTLDENNAACGGDVCLVNHFQGLTSCPYGQGQNGQPLAQGTSACTVPGTGAPVRPDATSGGSVTQAVNPWCTDRTASETVYCSCRCSNAEGNTNDGASYCACPTGYVCAQVVAAIQAGDPRAGGYCIKAGTQYDPTNVCSSECDPTTCP